MAQIPDLAVVAPTDLRTNWGGDDQGDLRLWTYTNISYSFPTGPSDPFPFPASLDHDEEDGFQMMSADQLAYARLAFELWDDLVPLNLTEDTTGSWNAFITFAYSSTTNDNGTYTSPELGDEIAVGPGPDPVRTYAIGSEHIYFSTDPANWFSQQAGNILPWNYGFQTMIHEIGHSLGLSHPGVYNGTAQPSDRSWVYDNRQYSVMSYFGGLETNFVDAAHPAATPQPWNPVWSEFNTLSAFSETPMLADVAAIQSIYGADMTTRVGDTRYGFGANTGRTYTDASGVTHDIYDFMTYLKTKADGTLASIPEVAPIFTIWDAGGHDTLDASLFWMNQEIDLRPGSYSQIGGYGGGVDLSSGGHLPGGNIAIAYGVTIEDAIGGSATDVMYGNNADNDLQGRAGDDVIDAGAGNDTVQGGVGNDNISGGAGNDVLYGNNTAGDPPPAPVTDDDTIDGGAGDDIIVGGWGDDTLRGGADNDVIWGDIKDQPLSGTGNDTIYGDAGNDTLHGGTGNDRLSGGDGIDTLYGEYGDDIMDGGAGDDILYGGQYGKDTLDGGAGNDQLTGGDEDDTFIYESGVDIITDFHIDLDDGFGDVENDRLDLSATSIHSYYDLIAHASYNGSSTTITFGGGNALTMWGVNYDDLDPGLVKFSEAPPEGGDFEIGDGTGTALQGGEDHWSSFVHVSATPDGGFFAIGGAAHSRFAPANANGYYLGARIYEPGGAVDRSGISTLVDAHPVPVNQYYSVDANLYNGSFSFAAVRSDGSFMAMWTGLEGDASSGVTTSIRAELFAADGTPLGPSFQVNASSYYSEYPLGVVAIDDNHFLFTWETGSDGYYFTDNGVRARMFDADGNAISGDITVPAVYLDYAQQSWATGSVGGVVSMPAINGGEAAIAWGGYTYSPEVNNYGGHDMLPFAYYITYIGSNGQVGGTYEIADAVDNGIRNTNQLPSLAASPSGRLLAAFTEGTDPNGVDVYSRLFVENGGGSNIYKINQTSHAAAAFRDVSHSYSWLPQVLTAGLTDGRFVVVWADATDNLVHARLVDNNGLPQGDEFTIARVTTDHNSKFQLNSVTALDDGTFVVSWYQYPTDNNIHWADEYPNRAVIIDPDSRGVILGGTPGNDTLTGSGYADRISGGLGNDILIGRLGGDILNGGPGNDTVDYSASLEEVYVDLRQPQQIGGHADGDVLISIENVTGSAYNDFITGDAGDNRLAGGYGNDNLAGLGGYNTLEGGRGNDTLWIGDSGVAYGGRGNDIIHGAQVGTGTLYGQENDDTLDASGATAAAVNYMTGAAGDDTLIGGPGTEIAAYSGHLADYTISAKADGSYTIHDNRPNSPDGTDTLTNIDLLTFSDFPHGLSIAAAMDHPPVITGGDTATATVVENFTGVVIDVDSTDADGEIEGAGITYSLSGFDAGYFSIDPIGRLSFTSPPDYENFHGSYHVVVQATDGAGRSDQQTITVNVTDVPGDPVTLDPNHPSAYYAPTAGFGGFDTVIGGPETDYLTVDMSGEPSGGNVHVTSDGSHLLIDADGNGTVDLTVSGVEELIIVAKDVVVTGDLSGTGLATHTISYYGADGPNSFDASGVTSGEDAVAYGYGGDDRLVGAGGDDTLDGGEGDDQLVGMAGDDRLLPGSGDNVVNGGDGVDTLVLDGSPYDYTITYDAGTASYSVTGPATQNTVTHVEQLEFAEWQGSFADFQALPPSTAVNSTASGNQSTARAVALSDGGYVVVWASDDSGDGNGNCVRARLFDADHHSVGPDFVIDSTGQGYQQAPAVSALPDGGFVVAWASGDDGDGSGNCIRVRVFDSAGHAAGADFIADFTTDTYKYAPSVAGLADGRIVVSWTSYDSGDGSSTGVRARIFDTDGTAPSPDFIVNTTGTSYQDDSSVAALADGRFVIAWTSYDLGDGDGGCVRARLFAADGTASSDFVVETTSAGYQYTPSVAALADGGFVVLWISERPESGPELRGQIFHDDGTRDGADFVVADADYYQSAPSVTALADGGFVASWTANDGFGTVVIHARQFDHTGAPAGGDLTFDDAPNSGRSSVAGLPDGTYVVTWDSQSGDLSGSAIRDAVVGNGAPMPITLIVGDDASNTINGTADKDLIYGFDPDGPQGQVNSISATRVATGLNQPLFAASPPDDPSRLFIVQKTGQIEILDLNSDQVLPTPFLDVSTQIVTDGEEGLLGLAFDPNFAQNGFVYINLINLNGDTEIRRYQVSATNPNIVDPASATLIISIDQPNASNHKGGWLGFGPDGYLYAALGDGGGGGDTFHNGQNMDSLLAKMLRLDVHSDAFPSDPNRNYAIPSDNPFVGVAGADEIWALGLRNPWRPSFDRGNGDFYIADVGQGTWEEINLGINGANYGWNAYEGPSVFAGGDPVSGGALTFPVYSYSHTVGHSITGGYVYRGPEEGLQGQYFFADFVDDKIFTLRFNGTSWVATERTAQITYDVGALNNPSSFGQDAFGNLYVVDFDGDIFRLAPNAISADLGDTIDGMEGDDLIFGGSGDDVVSGGDGNDEIQGGNGNDTLAGNIGTDFLSGGTGNDVINGGADGDTLVGDAGNDTLDGGTGADQMWGGKGNDTYVVDDPGDVVTENANEGTDLVQTALATYTLSNNVENLTFTGVGAFSGFGNVLDNVITGGAGNDTLDGDAGNDVLDGGAGTNLLNGGPGSDTVSYASAAAGITARLDLGFGQHSVDGLFDTYISIENVIGSDFGDTLVGLGGVANTLDGGNGDDFLYGEGIDTVIGGAGNDVFFGGQGSALNINLATSGVETVWGSFVGDVMDGSTASANLTMVGQGLTGGANADTMMGGSGDDFIYYRAGDVITGGSGNDWAVATLSSTGVTLNMTTTGFENAWGSTSDDTITAAGSATTVVMVGDTGNDTLTGGNAGDFLYGFNGNDTLTGGGGNDNLIGGADTDTFVFGANWGTDIVWDWQDGSEQFNMQGSGAANFAALAVNQNFSGSGNALISFGANQILVVGGANHIDAGDFIF